MGFRFRRRITLIPGVRINLSRSGTSLSFGGRGFWYTVGPNGKRRTTISAPGTGLSWTEEHRVRKPALPPPAPKPAAGPPSAAAVTARRPAGWPTWTFLAIVAAVIIVVLGVFQALQQATDRAEHSAQNTGGDATPGYQPGAASVKVIVPGTAPTAPKKPSLAKSVDPATYRKLEDAMRRLDAELDREARLPPETAQALAPDGPVHNGVNDRLLALSARDQAAMLGKAIGERCVGKAAFYMGIGKEGFAKDKAFWSLRCADRRAFSVEVDPDGATSVLECDVLEALNAGQCFRKFP